MLILCAVLSAPTVATARGGHHGGGSGHFTPSFHSSYRSAPPRIFTHSVRTYRPPAGIPPRFGAIGPHTRPIARRIRLHGGNLYVPAIVATGAPVLLDVPGIGPVSVDESRYQDMYQQLASDDAEAQERVWRELQEIKLRDQMDAQAPQVAPRPSGPTNMLPPGFGTARTSASADNVDLAERISFSDPPTAAKRSMVPSRRRK
jgi:hypothetical protein